MILPYPPPHLIVNGMVCPLNLVPIILPPVTGNANNNSNPQGSKKQADNKEAQPKQSKKEKEKKGPKGENGQPQASGINKAMNLFNESALYVPEPNDIKVIDDFKFNTPAKVVLEFLIRQSKGPDGKPRKLRVISYSQT